MEHIGVLTNNGREGVLDTDVCFRVLLIPAALYCFVSQVITELAPYVSLAERLGRLAVQLVSGAAGVKQGKVVYRSARAADDLDTRLLRAMIIKGLIEPVSDAFINLVNADYVAKQRGLRISEERQPADGAVDVPLETISVSCFFFKSLKASLGLIFRHLQLSGLRL